MISIEWLRRRVEGDVVLEGVHLAVDAGLEEAPLAPRREVLLELALRPRTTGARTLIRVSCGYVITCATIWSVAWR